MYSLNCYRAPIGQGYGLTETFAGAAFSEWDDYSVGRVGPPLPCCYIKVCHIFYGTLRYAISLYFPIYKCITLCVLCALRI